MADKYDWEAIKTEYMSGTISIRKLASKYGVSKSGLEKRMKQDGWRDTAKEMKADALNEVVKRTTEQRISTLESFTNATDLIVKALEERASQITPETDIRDIRTLTIAMRDIRDLRVFLTLDDKRETDARIAKLEKEAKEETDADRTMTIVVEGMDDICN